MYCSRDYIVALFALGVLAIPTLGSPVPLEPRKTNLASVAHNVNLVGEVADGVGRAVDSAQGTWRSVTGKQSEDGERSEKRDGLMERGRFTDRIEDAWHGLTGPKDSPPSDQGAPAEKRDGIKAGFSRDTELLEARRPEQGCPEDGCSEHDNPKYRHPGQARPEQGPTREATHSHNVRDYDHRPTGKADGHLGGGQRTESKNYPNGYKGQGKPPMGGHYARDNDRRPNGKADSHLGGGQRTESKNYPNGYKGQGKPPMGGNYARDNDHHPYSEGHREGEGHREENGHTNQGEGRTEGGRTHDHYIRDNDLLEARYHKGENNGHQREGGHRNGGGRNRNGEFRHY